MKAYRIILLLALGLGSGALHLLSLRVPDCFGFDQLRYFSQTTVWIWSLSLFTFVFFALFAQGDKLAERSNFWVFITIISLVWLISIILLKTSAPLLGDGLDRITSVRGGLSRSLNDQPAMLDTIIHLLVFQLLKSSREGNFLTYTIISYFAGVFYLISVIIFVMKFFSQNTERIFAFLILLCPGYIQLFAGYAENYSFLPGLVLLWMIGVKEAENKKRWLLVASQILLVFFHLFFLLLIPASIYALLTQPAKKNRVSALALALFGIPAGLASVFLVFKHYRGMSIFLDVGKILSLSHLSDFFNHQILACPGFLILALGIILVQGRQALSNMEKSWLIAGLIFLIFFFFLRPVIGAMRDWDLFSFPAMIYTPAVVAYLLPRLKHESGFLARFGSVVFVVSLFHTGLWLWVNHSEEKMVERIRFHLDEKGKSERWASAYGYQTLARYFGLTGRVDQATAFFEKSIEIHPDYSQNRLSFALHLWSLGRYQESLQQLEKAHQINPTNPEIKGFLAYFYLGYSEKLKRENRVQEAEEYRQKFLELNKETQRRR